MPKKKRTDENTKANNRDFYGKRIKYFRKNAGLSAEALGKALNVTLSSVKNWESGLARPDPDCIREMFRIFRIDPNTFYGVSETVGVLAEQEQRLIDLCREMEKEDRRLALRLVEEVAAEARRRKISRLRDRIRPVLSMNRSVSAGGGEDWEDYPEKKEFLLYSRPEVLLASEIMTVNGSSMEPRFHDGDLVLVQYTGELKKGDIGVLYVPGRGGVIKEVREDRLHSLNPDYDDILPDEDGAKVVGRVLTTVTEEMIPAEAEREAYAMAAENDEG